jgi:hypothetical protein
MWSPLTLELLKSVQAHNDSVWALALRADLLFSCSDDKSIKVCACVRVVVDGVVTGVL